MTNKFFRFLFACCLAVFFSFTACEIQEEDNWIIECEMTTAPELVGEWPFTRVRMFTNPDTLRAFSPQFCVDSTRCDSIHISVAPDQKYRLEYHLLYRKEDSTILDTFQGFETGLLNFNYCYYENPDADPGSADFRGRNLGEIVFIPDGGTQYVCDLEFNDSLFYVQKLRIDSMELSVTFER